ncbi:Arylsulfatase [Rosistilla carotiformis]|uniref:Arylsulfatase n=2 Tax=Rosistilla carotiformis TaxID=2528017 RepID=A0A518JVZ2_9BACT|nr:Arylsulfatase [Rosistilla carotiformis]
MIQFPATSTRVSGTSGCRRTFPRRLLHRMTTLVVPTLAALFAQTLFMSSLRAQSSDRPNVLVILTDDQGWGDLSVNGNTNLSTPNIDSLARDGASFDRFYVCPVCSPTRAEFLTGRYHARSGVYSTSAGGERMNLDERTIAETFRDGGYATGAFGKWHNGMQYPYHPNGRGFDEYYGFCSGHWGDYFSPPLDHNGLIVQGDGFCIDDFTNKAIAFMESNVKQNKPFFTYVPFNTPHAPMQVPDPYWDRFKDKPLAMRHRDPQKEDIDFTRAALAMCENIDDNVGRMLAKLDQWKIADNTIVIYFCDNGPNSWRWNEGMKGRKGATDEGGVRSPLFIRWPKNIPAGKQVTEIAAAIDLLPTLAELTGQKVGGSKPLDGRSLAPLLTRDDADWPDRKIVSHWKNRVSVRNQRFRLDNRGELFEIATDPEQRVNVAEKFPEVVSELTAAAESYQTNVAAGYDDDRRPFPIGHADYRYTQVPARDAIYNGKIVRSNRFPNCSYLTNWTRTEEFISWDATVGASGIYEVQLHYTCPAEDIGSTIELSFGDSKLTCKLTEAHDPPLRGSENDRVKRPESYVKDFKVVTLGRIELAEGPGQLKLKALEIPGDQVMDFRLLFFTKIQ